MAKKLNFLQVFALIWGIFIHSVANGLAMREIDDASQEVRKIVESRKNALQPVETSVQADLKSIARLETALVKGKEINTSLKGQIETYKAEKAELLKVQTTLASGLIGAVVTTIVAIAGALLSAKNSKPERDLKRLVVIEKARELKQSGISIPKDIELTYGGEIESKG
jgi:dsDNA-specific endonuclease/ATPase MutS2